VTHQAVEELAVLAQSNHTADELCTHATRNFTDGVRARGGACKRACNQHPLINMV